MSRKCFFHTVFCVKNKGMQRGKRKKVLTEWALISLAGVLLTLSFPPFHLYGFIWIALIPFFMLLEGERSLRKGFLIGFSVGVIHVSSTMYWISISVYRYGGLPLWGAAALTLLFILYLSLYWGLMGITFVFLQREKSSYLFPFAVALIEYVRGLPLIRFPWGGLEMALPPHLALSQIVDITGIYGLGSLICLVNYLIFRVWREAKAKRTAPALKQLLLILLVLTAAWLYGYRKIPATLREISTWKKVKVCLVQPDIDQSVKWKKSWQVKGLERYIRISEEAVKGFRPTLVVWPEAALTFYIRHAPVLFKQVVNLVRRDRFDLIFGATSFDLSPVSGKAIYHNSAYLLSKQGKILGRYDKIRLVPFGEYIPLRRWLPFAKNIVGTEEDFTPGKAPVPLASDIGPIGTTICFEGIFPDLSRALVRHGARLLVNITNDAWFGRSSGPYQHLRLSAYRAVEERTYLIRSTGTGISAIVGPTGRVLVRMPLQTQGFIRGIVRLREGPPSFYERFGNLFLILCAVFILIALLKETLSERIRAHRNG